jgi:hypothetical protein
MPIARLTVTAVSDEGDQVIVHGTQGDASTPTTFVFQTKGDWADVGMAERASRLTSGVEVVIDYTLVAEGWSVARGLSGGGPRM